jgi:hypothetical protein
MSLCAKLSSKTEISSGYFAQYVSRYGQQRKGMKLCSEECHKMRDGLYGLQAKFK